MTLKNGIKEQIRIFQEIPNSPQLILIRDQIEQRNQINEIEKWEEAKKQHIHDAQKWDQKQLREIEANPTPGPANAIYDQIEQ